MEFFQATQRQSFWHLLHLLLKVLMQTWPGFLILAFLLEILFQMVNCQSKKLEHLYSFTLISDIDAWIPARNDEDQFIEVNLIDEMPIYGLEMEGSYDLSSYTKAISVLFSSDAYVYHPIQDNHGSKYGEKVKLEPKFEIYIYCWLFRCSVQTWIVKTELELYSLPQLKHNS